MSITSDECLQISREITNHMTKGWLSNYHNLAELLEKALEYEIIQDASSRYLTH
jgi:hypothetical protein